MPGYYSQCSDLSVNFKEVKDPFYSPFLISYLGATKCEDSSFHNF